MKTMFLYTTAVISFILIMVACYQEQNKSKKGFQDSLNNASAKVERKIANENFDLFFKSFTEKSRFQLERIEFPLQNRIVVDDGEDEIKMIEKTEWGYMSFKDIKNLVINKTIISDHEVEVLLSVEDTGVHVVYTFKIKKGLWFLNSIVDESN